MDITKEQIEEIKNDKFFQKFANIFGLDLNQIAEEAKEELERQERINKRTEEILSEMNKKKDYVAPKCEQGKSFLMNKEQFEEFCKAYTELVNAENKLRYMFGVEFNEGGSGFGFSTNAREIIWNLIRIIFGDDNAEDIADFLYGNSNFDNAKNLYDELV
jgi:hypothetical protein